jgi:hypothetical protein
MFFALMSPSIYSRNEERHLFLWSLLTWKIRYMNIQSYLSPLILVDFYFFILVFQLFFIISIKETSSKEQ